MKKRRVYAMGAVVLLLLLGGWIMVQVATTPSPEALQIPVAMAAQPAPPSADLAAAAQHFLDTLNDEQRAQAVFSFDSAERFNWHFVPRTRQGLGLGAMTDAQRTAAYALLQTALTEKGYAKATGIVELEGILGRDPGRYYVSVFGTPSVAEPWGWRFEGHHLSLNFSSVTQTVVAATPSFWGANPAEVRQGERSGWRVLAAEEDEARALWNLLTDAQQQRARIANQAPRDIITGADRHARLERFEGLPAAEMTTTQQAQLQVLLDVYLNNMAADVATTQRDAIDDAGLDALYFAWAGSAERGEAHYYRLHGPTVLIEYDNIQNGANHIHAVWRDLQDDFAEDLLRQHYEQHAH